MTIYPDEQKTNLIERRLPPQNADVPRLSRETGIPKDTLYGWRRQALLRYRRGARGLTPTVVAGSGERWRAEEKFARVVETAALSEAERGEYCRKRGLYPEPLQAWRLLRYRRACEQAPPSSSSGQGFATSGADQAVSRRPANGPFDTSGGAADKRRIREWERELRRKEKALAEAAALRVLRKKAAAIGGTDEAV
jgi:transposase-like protein